MISREEAMKQIKAFKEKQAKSMAEASATVDAPKRVFKVARETPAAPVVAPKRVFKVARAREAESKVEPPAAPVAPAEMSVSKSEAVKQIKAFKETEAKVSTMAAKVKERKAMRLLKALVVARRAKKAAAAKKAAPAPPKTGSLEYFEKQKEKFKGTKYEKFVDEAIDKVNMKAMRDEVLENFKNPVKVQKLIDIFNQSNEESIKRQQEITAMMIKIPAPKGTKAQIIELIRDMVTNPVDRMKLRLEKRDKGTLQTIYMDTKARHDWYKKNEPGQQIYYNLDQ